MKVRCIDASDCGETLTVGRVYEVVRQVGRFGLACYGIIDDLERYMERRVNRFEPVTDEAEAPAEQPKVDPYEAHRLRNSDYAAERVMTMRGRDLGATARLHAGLESEKVRERVKAFPHPARNPR